MKEASLPTILKALISSANLTQKEVALEIEMREQAVSAYLNGKRSPTFETIEKIFAACDAELRLSFKSKAMLDAQAKNDDIQEIIQFEYTASDHETFDSNLSNDEKAAIFYMRRVKELAAAAEVFWNSKKNKYI